MLDTLIPNSCQNAQLLLQELMRQTNARVLVTAAHGLSVKGKYAGAKSVLHIQKSSWTSLDIAEVQDAWCCVQRNGKAHNSAKRSKSEVSIGGSLSNETSLDQNLCIEDMDLSQWKNASFSKFMDHIYGLRERIMFLKNQVEQRDTTIACLEVCTKALFFSRKNNFSQTLFDVCERFKIGIAGCEGEDAIFFASKHHNAISNNLP
jgi:hypothetical protein